METVNPPAVKDCDTMKAIRLILLVVCISLTTTCSKPTSAEQQVSGSKEEALPETQVVDIVNAANAKDLAKVTALLQANPKLVGAKFANGGPVNGWPLLMIAAEHGDKPMVDLLLRSGADVNDKNYDGEVALHYAALGGYKDIVQLLLDHKANVNVKSEIGVTPLKLVATEGKSQNANEIVALLKEHGAEQ
jgi:ankyrin repeat protein